MLSMEFADARPAVGREEIKMHYRPVKLSVEGRSCQLGRANAPMIPQLVHTIRGPKVGTGTSSPKRCSCPE
jgi:hypothetical protein